MILFPWHRQLIKLIFDLKDKVKELYAVGDCLSPRKAIDAIYDGHNVGRNL